MAPGQIVNIALTTCPFAVTQLPLNVSHPVHKDLLNPTKFERSLDNKIDVEKKEPQKKEIYILPVINEAHLGAGGTNHCDFVYLLRRGSKFTLHDEHINS